MRDDKMYAKVNPHWLRLLLRHPLAALGSHWVWQSLFYMDRTERWFKLGLDALGTALFAAIFSRKLGWLPGMFAAFLLTHTLNFLFNGHFWGIFKHYGWTYSTREEFLRYVNGMAARARCEPAIAGFVIFGSFSRAEWSPQSDLDARILRKAGAINGLRACWFLLKERTRALFRRFPLDVYILDGVDSKMKLNPNEKGIDLMVQFLS
jgi:hypothetical protein